MSDRNLTFTLNKREALILTSLIEAGMTLTERVLTDEKAPPKARMGALVLIAEGERLGKTMLEQLAPQLTPEEQEALAA